MEDLIKKVKSINIPGPYTVFGSAPLLAHGIINQCEDVDIITTPATFNKMKKQYSTSKTPSGSEKIDIGKGDVEIFMNWTHDVSPEKVISRSNTINGVNFANLNDVMNWKSKRKKPKDLKHIKLINNYLSQKDKAMNSITSMIDKVASSLEQKGLTKEAYQLDVIANTIEAAGLSRAMAPILVALSMFAGDVAGKEMSSEQLQQWLQKNKTKIEQAANKIMSPEQLKEIQRYESAAPVRVEKTRTTGGGRYTPRA